MPYTARLAANLENLYWFEKGKKMINYLTCIMLIAGDANRHRLHFFFALTARRPPAEIERGVCQNFGTPLCYFANASNSLSRASSASLLSLSSVTNFEPMMAPAAFCWAAWSVC